MNWVSCHCVFFAQVQTRPGPPVSSVSPLVPRPSDRTRPDMLHEDTQKRYVQEVQTTLAPEVAKQLEDFR